MKITFIRPHLSVKKAADALEPLVVAILKGLTPPHITTVFYDDRIEAVPLDEPTDLVVMTVETFTARRAYVLAAHYRQRGVPVVMGGFHPTLAPEEVRQYADVVAIGDAETIWPQIVADAQRGTLQASYRAAPPVSPINLTVDRSIFRGKSYPPVHLVQWGRGCGHQCDFCSIHTFYHGCQAQRPIDAVLAEIKQFQSPYILFVDDNLFVNHASFEWLLEALIPLRRRWGCQISVNVAQHAGLLRLMEQSGCVAALIGFESLSQENLRQMNKGWSRVRQDYETAIQRLYAHGIMVCGTFVLGYDDDSPAAFDQCLEFALRWKFATAHFNPLMPMPGTALYQRLAQEHRLIHDPWWLSADYRYGQAAFHPKRMTAAELTDGCFRTRRRFNSWTSIARRVLHPQANLRTGHHLLLYLATNYTNRREIYNKQGVELGAERLSETCLFPPY